MNILSLEVLLFIILFVFLYYIVPMKGRWIVLLFCTVSLVCYLNSPACAIFMLISVLVNYAAGMLIERSKASKIQHLFFTIGIAYDLFFLIRLATFAGIFPAGRLLAPLGISYYTLSNMGYLIDVHRGVHSAERNPFRYLLYGAYFPCLLSGPILTYEEMGERLYAGHSFDLLKITYACERMLWGLFKKMVISDRMSVVIDTVYSSPQDYPGFYILLAFCLFPVQLYADFSGCIDLIMGVSELFGVDLPENFHLPFLASSVAEFWRKWHITMGAWLRKYVFYAILRTSFFWKWGKTLKKRNKTIAKIPTWTALMLTWICIGVWHGGGGNYIFGDGIFFGMIIIAGEFFAPLTRRFTDFFHIDRECFSYRIFQGVRTYLLFAAGNSFFRSTAGLVSGFRMWREMFRVYNPWIWVDGSLLTLGLDAAEWFVLMVSVSVMIAAGVIRSKIQCSVREWIAAQNLPFRWLVWLGLIAAVLMWGWYGEGYTTQVFIYQQF